MTEQQCRDAARVVPRLAAALVGLVVGTAALLLPILVYQEKLYPGIRLPFWRALGFYTPLFIAIAFCGALAFLLLRFAVTSAHSKATSIGRRRDIFLKSLAVASTAGIVLSIVAVVVAIIRPPELRKVPWEQLNWAAIWEKTKESPVFLLLVFAVFISSFCWGFRRAIRSQK
jgi:hypothetical protein